MFDANQSAYRRRTLVSYYSQLQQLQPAERSICERLQDQLSSLRLLDIGVGGGRTTQHLARQTLFYLGIDYAPEMIAACQKRFAGLPETVQFAVQDARDLSAFANQSFDLIWFSYNGLDYMSHGERLQFLAEVKRLIAPGGYFCFSSHNLQGMEREFTLKSQLILNPVFSYVNLVMWLILRVCNRQLSSAQLSQLDYAVIRDASHNFRLQTYYIRPQAQLEQLAQFFGEVTVYGWQSGQAIAPPELAQHREMWLYYLCSMP